MARCSKTYGVSSSQTRLILETLPINRRKRIDYISDKLVRQLVRKHSKVRVLVQDWYDGPLSDLMSFEGRFMARRLVFRAIRELEANNGLFFISDGKVVQDSLGHVVTP